MEKIKSFIGSEKGKDLMLILVVILVGFGAFELGRLSKISSSGIKVEYLGQNPENSLNIIESPKAAQKGFFGSSKGNKYYPVGCAAGNNIKMENRIYFASPSEAEGAGYTQSASCE